MNYISMTKAEIANGRGVRVALWVSGCDHHCENCQNPETWDCKAGRDFTGNDLNRLIKELSLPYYDGLTLTGGDPLHPQNIKTIEYIASSVKTLLPNKTIWCYTGYKFEDVKDLNLMKYIDVLIDGEYVDSLRDITLPFVGSPNQRIIDIPKTLQSNQIVLYNTKLI